MMSRGVSLIKNSMKRWRSSTANSIFRTVAGCTLLLCLGLSPFRVTAGETYDRVFSELTAYDNRLPGSEGYQESLVAIEAALKDAGLNPKRQYFSTLVPDTKTCVLKIAGRAVEDVYALGPNSHANNTSGGHTLSGPIVWLGEGSLEEMRGKPVEGCIAVLRFDSPNLKTVLSQGALAVVFVGDGSETQWEVRSQFFDLSAEIPRLFVTEKTAKRSDLLDATGDKRAELKVTTVWKDVDAYNIWVQVPGKGVDPEASKAAEAVVLSATYDTFGAIPEQTPGIRKAANCALLAEVLAGLKARPLKRTVVGLFLGSHYAAQEGARNFYFAFEEGMALLKKRETGYKEVIQKTVEIVEDLQGNAFFESEHSRDIAEAIDKNLETKVSDQNFALRKLRTRRRALSMRKERLPSEEQELKQIAEDIERLEGTRKGYNSLRRQVLYRQVTEPDAFRDIADEELAVRERELRELKQLQRANRASIEIVDAFSGGATDERWTVRLTGHYGFDFADGHRDWTLDMHGSGAQMFYHSINRKGAEIKIGKFSKHLRTLSELYKKVEAQEDAEGPSLFVEPAVRMEPTERFCVPSTRSVPSRVAQARQIYGYQMLSIGDSLDGDELPYAQKVSLVNLVPWLTAFCEQLAVDPELSQPSPLEKTSHNVPLTWSYRESGGKAYLTYMAGTEDASGPPENAILVGHARRSTSMPYMLGHSYGAFSRIYASGHVFLPMMNAHMPFWPYGYNEKGSLIQFPGPGNWRPSRLFFGHGGVVAAPIQPGSLDDDRLSFSSGTTDAPIQGFTGHSRGVTSIFAAEKDPLKIISPEGLLVLNNTAAEPKGTGVWPFDPPLYAFDALRQCARDYLNLNASRLKILREKSIVNDSLESLHADAEQHWEEAKAARDGRDVPLAVGHEMMSAGMSARVASPLREVTNDMVRAVVLLLLLILPFAFVMERLFISATSIYNQVMGFAAFFVGSFVLLYLVHPAFSIASSPLVIFLAFIIILLSVIVIALMMSKFKKELKAIQGLSTSAHGVSSESSTALAAVLIGVSGMRNRPLKTFLTALTIILLTFAIVVFASFSPVIGVSESYLGKGDGHNRIELRRSTGLGMPREMLSAYTALYEDGWTLFRREALFAGPGALVDGHLTLLNEANEKWLVVDGAVAFDPGELAFDEGLADSVSPLKDYEGELPPILLSDASSADLGLAVGDQIKIAGKSFEFAGVFKASVLEQLQYMDGGKYTPPDFERTEAELGPSGETTADLSRDESVDTSRFTYLSARNIAVTSVGSLRELQREELDLQMNAIMMYAGDSVSVEAAAEEISKVFVGPVMAKGVRGANRFFFSKSLQASGFSVVIVPLLLGGLIIFNSLLGSIVERQKEIFTYSAMGLAPPDVGALFFAESSVYAILGGMGGYLVSQVAAKTVNFMGHMGWFTPPELNFSSLSSVLTIFVVMAMVIISTIYPAIKAGKSANPGVSRKWRMPVPSGDDIEFVFPFTVSAEDMGGILAFIAEHFDNHGDASIGSFASANVRLFKVDESGNLGIRANVSLAPFDLGLMQQFEMHAQASEIEGIDEVVVRISRRSGARGAWLRGNRVFVSELREQFLLWRSLPVETVAHYRAQSAAIAK